MSGVLTAHAHKQGRCRRRSKRRGRGGGRTEEHLTGRGGIEVASPAGIRVHEDTEQQHALSWASQGGSERTNLQLLALSNPEITSRRHTKTSVSGKACGVARHADKLRVLRDEHQRCQGVPGAAGDPAAV